MMGLHHTYPVTWGSEKIEGLTLDLGLEMFAPLPTESPTGSSDRGPHAPLQSNRGRKRGMSELNLANVKAERDEMAYIKLEFEDNPTTIRAPAIIDLTSSDDDEPQKPQTWKTKFLPPDFRPDSTKLLPPPFRPDSMEFLPLDFHPQKNHRDAVPWMKADLSSRSHQYTEPEAQADTGLCIPIITFPIGEQQQEITSSECDDIDDYMLLDDQEMPQSSFTGQQVVIEKPVVDVNQAIREMPQDTAEAFEELFRLVGDDEIASNGAVKLEAACQPSNACCVFDLSDPGPVIPRGVTDIETEHHVIQHPNEQHVGVDLVLYEPKDEPLDTWSENTSHLISVGTVPGSALAPWSRSRNVIDIALKSFDTCRLHIVKDPSYGQTSSDDLKTSGSKRLRADLKAACVMRKKGFWLNEKKRPIGEVPGVVVGDCFKYRIEMALIGLHRAVQAGIAVVPVEYSPFGVTVASSVVIGVADPYQDDHDMGDQVVYSGQGGLCGKTKESQDQELKRGNLAMSNSYQLKVPIRLIRGHKDQQSPTGIVYSYDGLYQIVDMNYVTGVNGKKVYKFNMHRLQGQPPISCRTAYPTPLGSQGPGLPTECLMEIPEKKPLYLEKHPTNDLSQPCKVEV